MNAEQLIARIKASPDLAASFCHENRPICPCCVQCIVAITDQKEVETVINIITQCESHANEVKAKICELTRELQKDLDQTNERSRKAVHSLYEFFNSSFKPAAAS